MPRKRDQVRADLEKQGYSVFNRAALPELFAVKGEEVMFVKIYDGFSAYDPASKGATIHPVQSTGVRVELWGVPPPKGHKERRDTRTISISEDYKLQYARLDKLLRAQHKSFSMWVAEQVVEKVT